MCATASCLYINISLYQFISIYLSVWTNKGDPRRRKTFPPPPHFFLFALLFLFSPGAHSFLFLFLSSFSSPSARNCFHIQFYLRYSKTFLHDVELWSNALSFKNIYLTHFHLAPAERQWLNFTHSSIWHNFFFSNASNAQEKGKLEIFCRSQKAEGTLWPFFKSSLLVCLFVLQPVLLSVLLDLFVLRSTSFSVYLTDCLSGWLSDWM